MKQWRSQENEKNFRRKLSATDARSLRTLLLVSAFEPLEIGHRIARARQEADGMTQEELADLLGVSTRSVQGYEAGDVVPWKHFSRLESIFHQPLESFLHGERAEVVADAPSILLRLAKLEETVARADDVQRGFQALEAAIAQLALPRTGEAEPGG